MIILTEARNGKKFWFRAEDIRGLTANDGDKHPATKSIVTVKGYTYGSFFAAEEPFTVLEMIEREEHRAKA